MIHIEKLSLKNIGRYTWQTFVDQFISNQQNRFYFFEKYNIADRRDIYLRNEILTPDLLPKLNNVCLGKHYGIDGIDIDILLIEGSPIENLVIEISPEHFRLLVKSKYKLKALLENYTVILNDFEECGTLFGFNNPTLVEFLSKFNILPKQLFLVGGCFDMHDYPQLNIFKIQFDYWLICTALTNDFYSNAIFDINYKQSMLDELDNQPKEFCLIPTLKPKLPRIKLLSYLEKLQVLDKCEWSCGYNLVVPNLRTKIDKVNELGKEDIQFLARHNFPKLFKNIEIGLGPRSVPQTTWFNRYNYYVSAETYMGDEYTNEMGNIGFISEKTYKSFMIGAAPIIYGPPKSNSYLNKLGFKTILGDEYYADYKAIGKFLEKQLTSITYEKNIVKHNFDLITDKHFLVDQIAQPLNKIAELINSIRR